MEVLLGRRNRWRAHPALGSERGITNTIQGMIRLRSAIESATGSMRMDEQLGRNPLTGA